MILSTLTKKLAEIKGEECNLWKFPKTENQEFFLLTVSKSVRGKI